MSIRPKQLARMGTFHLEEAVLDVLLEAKHEGECIGAAEISRRAGIFRLPETPLPGKGRFNDAIVTGLLTKMLDEGRAQKCPQRAGGREDGWELTEKEFAMRRDDV